MLVYDHAKLLGFVTECGLTSDQRHLRVELRPNSQTFTGLAFV